MFPVSTVCSTPAMAPSRASAAFSTRASPSLGGDPTDLAGKLPLEPVEDGGSMSGVGAPFEGQVLLDDLAVGLSAHDHESSGPRPEHLLDRLAEDV